jgi:predicted ATP-grasp superfamily ATP-dependent carboligase
VNYVDKSALPLKPAILVPQADSLGAIAVIRSLGQHGYQVHAASTKPNALGCRSSFARYSHTSPSYQSHDYLPWLRQIITTHQIQAIVPSEGFLLAIKSNFSEFAALMDIPGDEDTVYACLSKVDVFDRFVHSNDARLAMHIPKSVIIASVEDFSVINFPGWKLPFFIKGDAKYNRNGDDALVARINTIASFQDKVSEALNQFEKILIQDCYSGEKVTVNLLLQDDKSLAESMVLGIHQNPHTGGVMSLRQSWWQDAIYDDAIRRLRALNWQGAAMVEYKWDRELQQFAFIELNARYWGALNLDILADLHFPTIQFDYFFSKQLPTKALRLTKQITVRHALPADFGYLLSKLRDPSVRTIEKLKSAFGFFIYFLRPGISSDLNYPGDRKLVVFNAKTFFSDLIRSLVQKF